MFVLLVVAGAVDIQKRVLNGHPCLDSEGQHYVVLSHASNDKSLCRVSLMYQEWVLTAEDCQTG